jgi:hypothetical protein
MKRLLTGTLLTVLALLSVTGDAKAQSISTLVAGAEDNGSYLWQFLVNNDKATISKNISHFTFNLCDTALNSLITSSIKYAEVGLTNNTKQYNVGATYEIFKEANGKKEPHSNMYGIKFDDGFDGIKYRIVEFRLNLDLVSDVKTINFKAGTNNYKTTFVGPGCTVATKIPEPGSIALLGLGALAMGMVITRRRR